MAKGTVAHLGIRPDYGKTMFEVCREVALQSIKQFGCLQILYYVDSTMARNSGQPSWIPRWDLNQESSRHTVLPYLYDSSKKRPPCLSKICADSIRLRGIHIGSISKIDPVLPIGGPEAVRMSSLLESVSRLGDDPLMSLSRIMAQDTWSGATGGPVPRARASRDLDVHFANFAAYMIESFDGRQQNTYIPSISFLCDRCERIIIKANHPTSEPTQKFSCSICRDGLYDVCLSCYESGQRCLSPGHTLQLSTSTGF